MQGKHQGTTLIHRYASEQTRPGLNAFTHSDARRSFFHTPRELSPSRRSSYCSCCADGDMRHTTVPASTTTFSLPTTVPDDSTTMAAVSAPMAAAIHSGDGPRAAEKPSPVTRRPLTSSRGYRDERPNSVPRTPTALVRAVKQRIQQQLRPSPTCSRDHTKAPSHHQFCFECGQTLLTVGRQCDTTIGVHCCACHCEVFAKNACPTCWTIVKNVLANHGNLPSTA